MASMRAEKSGFAKEAKEKIDAKYDASQASQLMSWISDLLKEAGNQSSSFSTDGSVDSVYETLKDGTILCRLVNALQPNSIPESKIKPSKMAFKCMETISLFLDSASKLGVQEHELFRTVDLWEQQNMAQVTTCLQSLARKASKWGKQSLGPKESEANRRSFTEEQLKAGDTIVSLQYGSNKGATQQGLSFGNTRHM